MRLLLLLFLVTTGMPDRSPVPVVPPVAVTAAGAYRLPLAGPLRVARDFDPPAARFGAGHRGVDLAAPAESAVLASGPGVVSFAGVLAGRIVVAVTHPDGLRTTYEPLSRLDVQVRDVVAGGARLGVLAVGHPGCTAPEPVACLHWGAFHLVGGGPAYLNPLLLLDRLPVELLPPIR